MFLGATISSEKTAAQEGVVGELRRDPFAMLPFCGYNMADYWSHWLEVGGRLAAGAADAATTADGGPDAGSGPDARAAGPRIFQVNWFRKDADGAFLWPGFGENARVLEWILDRVDGTADAVDSPLGAMPTREGFDTTGLDIDQQHWDALFAVDRDSWLTEVDGTAAFFGTFEGRVPAALHAQLEILRDRLSNY